MDCALDRSDYLQYSPEWLGEKGEDCRGLWGVPALYMLS